MDFCELKLKQLDHETADIKVAVNIETLETLLRKKRKAEVFAWYLALSQEIRTRLEKEFGEGEDGLGSCSIRTHRGHNTAGIPFVSVVVLAKVLPSGWNLTSVLTTTIIRHIQDAMEKAPEIVAVTATKFNQKRVAFEVDFDVDTLKNADMETVLTAAKDALQREIEKGYWNVRL